MNTEQQIYTKCEDAVIGGEDAWSRQSTGERLAVALVLNRPDWLGKMGYTIAGAIRRVGADWLMHIPDVAGRIESMKAARDSRSRR